MIRTCKLKRYRVTDFDEDGNAEVEVEGGLHNFIMHVTGDGVVEIVFISPQPTPEEASFVREAIQPSTDLEHIHYGNQEREAPGTE